MHELGANIADRLSLHAKRTPSRDALIVNAKTQVARISFAELDQISTDYASGLQALGLEAGKRVVLMAPPTIDFFALVFAVFKANAVLVLIDPGIERKALLQCLTEIEPAAFIGVPLAHVARRLFPKPFRRTTTLVTVGSSISFGGKTTAELKQIGQRRPLQAAQTTSHQIAAILFTSGSTGVPKGAVYTHGMFGAQVDAIAERYSIRPGGVELCTFAPFAIFNPALGVTAVLPDMDFRFPGDADPIKVLTALQEHRCTTLFGAPALVDRVGRYCHEHGIELPSIQRVLSAGAPLRVDVVKLMQQALPPGAEIFTPYGATEALPVASIGSAELLQETAALTAKGHGICVGTSVPLTEVKIIQLTDEVIESWFSGLELPNGTIGEIAVRGPVTTQQYFERPDQTRLSKIRDQDTVWHRMGDVGYLDSKDRLWMCGRKSQRVVAKGHTHFSVCVEEVFNQHPKVKRTALVGVGQRGAQVPVLLVERREETSVPDDVLLHQLRTLALEHGTTHSIEHLFVYPSAFPVDRRHNSKIVREALVPFATQALR